MAGNVIRQDIVQIGFEVENNPLADLSQEAAAFQNNLVGAVSAGVGDLQRLASAANLANSDIGNMSSGTEELRNSMSGAVGEIESLANQTDELRNNINSSADSLENLADVSQEVNSKGLSDYLDDLRSIAGQKMSNIKNFFSDLKSLPSKGLDAIKNTLSKIRNMDLGDVGESLDIGLGHAITASVQVLGKLKDIAGISFKKLGAGLGSAVKAGGKGLASLTVGVTKGLGTATGVLAGGVAVATGALGAGVASATEYKKALNNIQAQTGYTSDYTEEFGQIMSSLYRDNMGEGYDDIAQSLATVAQQTGSTGQELEGLTHNALLVRDTFEFEVTESTRTAQMMMKQFGMSGDEAYNLIAQGAQYGLNQNDNLLDSMNEYAVHFKQIGLGGEEMMNMMANGAKEGVFDVDKLGDAMKEFGIRSKDGSDASMQAFKDLGLDGKKMTKAFGEGGESGKAAFQGVTAALAEMKDPVEQNAAGVALFGTMWEDVGAKGILAMSQMNGSIQGGTDALEELNKVKYDDLGSAFGGIQRNIVDGLVNPIANQFLPTINAGANVLKGFTDEITGVLGDGFQAGDENALGEIFGRMIETGANAIKTALPKIINIVIPILNALLSSVAQVLPTLLPVLLDGAIQLVMALLNAIQANQAPLVNTAVTLITSFAKFLLTALPQIIMTGIQLLVALIQGIAQQLPTLIPMAIQAILTLVQGIVSMLPTLVEVAIILIQAIVQGLLSALPQLITAGLSILTELIWGIIQAIPQLINAVLVLIPVIVTTLMENLPLIVEGGIQLLIAVIAGIAQAIPLILGLMPEICNAIIEGLMQVNWLEVGGDLIKGVGKGLFKGAKSLFTGGKKTGEEASTAVADGIDNGLPAVDTATTGISTQASTNLAMDNSKIAGYGTNGVSALATGLTSGTNQVENASLGVVSQANNSLSGITNTEALGSTSVSNLSSGISNNTGAAVGAMTNLSSQVQEAGNTEVVVHISADTASLDGFNSQLQVLVESSTSILGGLSSGLKKELIIMNGEMITGTNQMYVTFSKVMNQVKGIATASMQSIQNTVNSLSLFTSGQNIVAGLERGMLSKKAQLLEMVRQMARQITTTVNEELDIHSPSRVLEWSGENTGLGLIKGIVKTVPKVKTAAVAMTQAVQKPVNQPFKYNPTSQPASVKTNTQTNTYNPVFNISINGSTNSRQDAFNIKKIVREAIQESYKGIGRVSPRLREV